ncbi:tumor necrosis factor receptor superfamily member 14 [Tiliqua scincoides]|uniref:tumor necrosis factor receptor superfamily member 14 n=1 Tax=Tiliqua scincoides TaxID=71010 RepID=UPI0034631B6A
MNLPDLSSRTMPQIFCISLCLLLATELLGLEATTCKPWEYQIKENCCPKCGIGERVSRHCTVDLGTTCLPCTEGTYTDHPNGLTECLRCHSCDPGSHLRIKEPCTYTKNTVCSCSPGYFCILSSDGGCELCQKHTVSRPGYKVTQPGTETSDTKYEPCPPKTFSVTENASLCQLWTNCSEKGLKEKRAGSNTSDAVCEPHERSHTATVAASASLVILVLLVVGILVYLIRRKSSGKDKPGKPQEANGDYVHVQELDTNVRTPMQETAPNLGEPSYA